MPTLLVASLVLLLQAGPGPGPKYDVPQGWTSKPLSSKMTRRSSC